MTTRREFLERTTTVAALGAFSIPPSVWAPSEPRPDELSQGGSWNVAWPSRISGRHKALFDVAEVESGYGVWRASAWARQYMEVLKAPASEVAAVIVLRHNAIVLAMQQVFWDTYNVGKTKLVTHPLTSQLTDRNPALLDEATGIPAPFDQAALHKQLARGVVVLACDLALRDCAELIKSRKNVSDDVAHKEAVANLVPGVILQPSGVFAAVLAQEAGCAYVRSS